VFLRDQIPSSISIACYILLSVLTVVVVPYLYPQLRSHQVAFIFLSMPFFASCNVYGLGMTDINHVRQARHARVRLLRGPQLRRRHLRALCLRGRDGEHDQRRRPDAGPQDRVVGWTPRCSPPGGYSARDRVLDP
jgi:hypothetical protein